MSVVASQLVAEVSVKGADEAKAQLLGVGAASDSAGGMLSSLAAGGALIAGAAIVGIGVKSVEMAGNFQDAMTQLVTGAGESKANIDMVSQGILNMAVTTGTSTTQLSQGMYMIESAGYHGAAGLAVLQAAAEGAKVGNASLADVANGVTTAMTDYAASGLTATQATNILIATVANGKTHMADLARSMSTILPTAAAVGVKFTDVSGAMATMTSEGTSAAQSATYLRQLLMALETPAKAGATALKSIGLTSGEVSGEMKKSLPGALQLIMTHLAETYKVGSPQYMAALKNIAGGSKQMQGMLELTGEHLKTFNSNVKTISGSAKKAGDSISGWADVQNNFNFKLSQAKEVVETLMIKIGTALLPVLSKVLDIVTPLISKFSDWITSGNGLGAMFQKVSDFIGGFFKSLSGGAKSSPFSALIDDAKQVAGVLQGPLKDAFNQVSTIVGGVFANHMKTAQGIIADLSKWFSTTLQPAIKQAMPGFEALAKTIIQDVVPGMAKLWAIGQKLIDDVLPPLVKVFEAVVPVAVKLAGIISGGLSAALKFLMPYIVQAASAIEQFAKDIATRVAPILEQFFNNASKGIDMFMKIWNKVWPILAPILKGVWDEIVGVIKIAWAIISGIIKIALDLLSGNWKQAWNDLKTMLSGVWDGIKTLVRGGFEIVKGIFTGAMAAVKGIFTSAWDGIKHIFMQGVQAVANSFKPLLEAMSHIPGPIGSMASSVLNSINSMSSGSTKATQTMATQTSAKMASMKVSSLTQVAELHAQAAEHFEKMRQALIKQIADTSDPVKKKALEMKLGVVTAAEDTQKKASEQAAIMAQKVAEKTKQMAAAAAVNAQDAKEKTGNSFTDMASSVGKKVSGMWSNVSSIFSNAWSNDISGPLTGLWNNVTGTINGWATDMLGFGATLIQNLASGISGAVGDVTGAIGNVMGAIGNFLPHSPAKEGELKHLNEYGPALVRGLSEGVERSIPQFKVAMTHLVQPAAALGSAAPAGGQRYAYAAMAPNPNTQIAQSINGAQGTPVIFNLNGQQFARIMMPLIVNSTRNATGIRGY